LLRWLEKSE